MNTLLFLAWMPLFAPSAEPIPDKVVVLTFDDSSKSHHTVARPLLLKHRFGATFFITEGFDFPTNKKDYMTWEEIAQLHRDGFEIGNHTIGHQGVTDKTLPDLSAQVRGINLQCEKHGIPKPVSFAYPGNAIVPGALPVLNDLGIRFARRGGSPEHPYKEGRGFAFEPGKDHPLLLPSAGDARPTWTLEDLKLAVGQARNGKIGHRARLGEHRQGPVRELSGLSGPGEIHRHRLAGPGEVCGWEPGTRGSIEGNPGTAGAAEGPARKIAPHPWGRGALGFG